MRTVEFTTNITTIVEHPKTSYVTGIDKICMHLVDKSSRKCTVILNKIATTSDENGATMLYVGHIPWYDSSSPTAIKTLVPIYATIGTVNEQRLLLRISINSSDDVISNTGYKLNDSSVLTNQFPFMNPGTTGAGDPALFIDQVYLISYTQPSNSNNLYIAYK